MLRKKRQRAFLGQRRRRRMARCPLVTVKAVLRWVHMHLHARVRHLERLHAVHGDVVVLVAKVGQHGHLGAAGNFTRRRHATAIVGRGGGQAADQSRSTPGKQPAPAVAHDAHLAGMGHVVHASLNVLHHAGVRQRLDGTFERKALGHAFGRVAQVHTRLGAVEGGRGDGQVTLRGVTVRHGADVLVHAKDFLQHDDCALGLARGFCHVGRKGVAVQGCEVGKAAHGFKLLEVCVAESPGGPGPKKVRPPAHSWVRQTRPAP